MPEKTLRIQWAPKVRRNKIKRLYHNDALGLVDDELIAEVGFNLLQRCQSILMVTEGSRVICPQCNNEIVCPGERWSRQYPIVCPNCAWKATYGQYRDSWRHQELMGGNAVFAFQAYAVEYPKASSPQERLLLIDRLIHSFHWSIRNRRNHAPAANQLIEGGLEEVIAFLDELTYGEKSIPELKETNDNWRQTLEEVAKTFPFVREKLRAKGKPPEEP